MKHRGEAVCGECGYVLEGATTSSACPECGKALVDVLERRPTGNTAGYKRYRSTRTVFGWPLVDVALGAEPGQRMGHARGVIAIGDDAYGLVAIGVIARGGVAIGSVGIGVVSMGGLGVGIAAMGGFAIGGLAAFGGMCVSGFYAFGGMAAGHVGMGGFWYQIW